MKQRILALGCTVGLAFSLLAGCQAVAGVELDKVVQNALSVESFEGSATLQLELEGIKAKEGYPDLATLANATLVLDEIKQQDKDHRSVKGELRYENKAVPLHLSVSGEETLLLADGSTIPLVLDGEDTETKSESTLPLLDIGSLDWQQLLQEHIGSLLQYIPKSESLTVSDAKVTINGEELELTKLHVELTGSELLSLIQTTLKNVLADEEGSNAIIRAVLGEAAGENDALVIGFARQLLRGIAEDPAQLVPELADYLNDSNSLQLDVYADGDSQIRRYEFVLNLNAPEAEDSILDSITASGVLDRWNINQTVAADLIAADGAVHLSEPAGLAHYIKTLDTSSQAYKLLIEDIKVTRKNIVLPAVQVELPGEEVRPYILEGSTLVPLRFVAENLDAQVEWNQEAQQAIVTDVLTGKELVFTIGSALVTVNGQEYELEVGAQLTGGSTYVPVRFIAESLGAEVGWDPETYTVSIIRN